MPRSPNASIGAIRRLRVDADIRTGVEEAIASSGVVEAPLNHEVALLSRKLALRHSGPAERFLAATASVYDLTLLTADERLQRGKGYWTVRA